jgi:uncharacterized membrane protein (UPF0182 family)
MRPWSDEGAQRSLHKVPAPRFRLPCDSGRRDSSPNERLTALAAIPLVVLLAVEGVTLLSLRSLLPVHVFVGMLLVLPAALKLASTAWRFVRYYARDPEYVRRGPPQIVMRLLAPILAVSTISVLASGIALVFTHAHHGLLLLLHKASFVIWGPTFGVHFLVYVWRVPRAALESLWRQRVAVAAVLALAVVAAVLAYTQGHPSLSGWFHPDFDSDGDFV